MTYLGTKPNPATRGRGVKKMEVSEKKKHPTRPRVNPQKRFKTVKQRRPKQARPEKALSERTPFAAKIQYPGRM